MTAGGCVGDYELGLDSESSVLRMGLVVGVAVAVSSWLEWLKAPCIPAVVLAIALLAGATRRRRRVARDGNADTSRSESPRIRQTAVAGIPSLEAGWCQLAIYWVVSDRALCFARELIESRADFVLDHFTHQWLLGCQIGWLLLMALLAATTLSQAWSAELQAAVLRMRSAPHR